jgi:hypothetical protein
MEYQAAHQSADSIVKARRADEPTFIDLDEYDAVQTAGHEPYNRLLNDLLGPGGWDNISITTTVTRSAPWTLIEGKANAS